MDREYSVEELEQKQSALENLLRELSNPKVLFDSSNEDVCNEYCEKLVKIYTPGYRHLYSGLFGVITQIDVDHLAVLSQNMAYLYSTWIMKGPKKDTYTSDFKRQIRKLYDHVSLDINRNIYLKMITHDATEVGETVSRLQHESEDLQEKLENIQKNYVATLGIFASIVITFSSGLGFSKEIMAMSGSISIYRLSFLTLLLGFILFNILNALFAFLLQMIYVTKKDITDANYKRFFVRIGNFSEDGESRDDVKLNKISLAFKINAVLIGFMVLSIIAWMLDVVQFRELFVQCLYK